MIIQVVLVDGAVDPNLIRVTLARVENREIGFPEGEGERVGQGPVGGWWGR